ncbi:MULTISPECIES: class I SAM-dependent methyltransferase [Vibrio]|uniref:SAM-dependent methyltransferase n=2 Tax=Vibrio cyclitrophicus TaxID=47951 RepID=A0A7Z1MJR3_9VIBR|nr:MULTISPECIES: class I SAM-dependent methyltransferase [Vibrio]MBE8606327.1 class I SAM-dependent methyltransferase [Vibrio sp. OPT10]MBU2932276.1 class I SAM-dependent methyltransferase [Vibrio cyclitrophicus]OED99021.1 SAM-dependent methyltransferase [Vibrio cyclitrophicus ZF28]OEE23594.1 SAM-dependent methyltransferase [Vibrio cyclitrophicus ZF14]OEF36457.1 SAM-dependent methyltransferase [Vibrio cyclitrophicus 1F289]
MHWLDRFKVFRYHRKQTHRWKGNKAKSLGWTSEESQLCRFEVIARSADFEKKSVLDLGCGYGELFELLDSIYRICSYTGVDQHTDFLNKAKQNYTEQRCEFLSGDMSKMNLEPHDMVIASGSLNYISRDTDYLTNMITRMFGLANQTVIFNLLNSSQYPSRNTLMSYHPDGVYRFCKTLCDDVSLIEGYAEGDFTIVMNKSV